MGIFEKDVENVRDFKWAEQAYKVAAEAGKDGQAARRRWAGQNEYDADNMHTECTRFNNTQDARLRRCCREARVTRYTLISYLLRCWMAAWETYQNRG